MTDVVCGCKGTKNICNHQILFTARGAFLQLTICNLVKKTNSLYINFYYYLCIKLQHQGVE